MKLAPERVNSPIVFYLVAASSRVDVGLTHTAVIVKCMLLRYRKSRQNAITLIFGLAEKVELRCSDMFRTKDTKVGCFHKFLGKRSSRASADFRLKGAVPT